MELDSTPTAQTKDRPTTFFTHNFCLAPFHSHTSFSSIKPSISLLPFARPRAA
jgi:hypothetical protein